MGIVYFQHINVWTHVASVATEIVPPSKHTYRVSSFAGGCKFTLFKTQLLGIQDIHPLFFCASQELQYQDTKIESFVNEIVMENTLL